MIETQASATAIGVAMRRAAHQFIDTPKIFDDPIALRIIGHENALELQSDPHQTKNLPPLPHVRAILVARSRYTEEQLAIAVENGVTQYVILGAGLDTFAYRNPYPEDKLRVFEVDHPATQTWKKNSLKENNIKIPANLTYVTIDFNKQTLSESLLSAGYNPNLPTFFSFLGVSYYLTLEGFMETIRFIASGPAGNGVVFDYAILLSLLPAELRVEIEGFMKNLAAMGEPWQSLFDPKELINTLRNIGFGEVIDFTPAEINSRFFSNRNDDLHVRDGVHIMSARKT